MRCQYIGKSDEHDCREAYITSESHEEKIFDKMYDFLTNKGWKLECEEECTSVIVCDKAEYNDFFADYKDAKKRVKENYDLCKNV